MDQLGSFSLKFASTLLTLIKMQEVPANAALVLFSSQTQQINLVHAVCVSHFSQIIRTPCMTC